MSLEARLLALGPFGSGRSTPKPRADFDDRFAATYLDPHPAISGRTPARNRSKSMTVPGERADTAPSLGVKAGFFRAVV